jgi:hypothetical protein
VYPPPGYPPPAYPPPGYPQVAQPPDQATGLSGFHPPGPAPDAAPEPPSLVKELPIASYVLTPVFAVAGALVNVLLGGNAINELKDPSQHTTPDATHDLVVKARVGQVVSGALFGLTGIFTVYGTVKTVRVVLKFKDMVKVPQVGVTIVPLPDGAALGVGGRF